MTRAQYAAAVVLGSVAVDAARRAVAAELEYRRARTRMRAELAAGVASIRTAMGYCTVCGARSGHWQGCPVAERAR